LFSSRSDFIRDAIRARLIEVRKNILGKEVKEKPEKKELAKEEEAVEEVMEEMEEHKFGGVH
jgi:Arc/MetJ-type ribon-helix-helix transcriptional regulator